MRGSIIPADFLKYIADIVKAGAQGPFGIFALVLVVSCGLAVYLLVRSRKGRAEMAIFGVASAGFLVIAFFALSLGRTEQNNAATKTIPIPIAGSQETHGTQSPAIGTMSGGTINYGTEPKEERQEKK